MNILKNYLQSNLLVFDSYAWIEYFAGTETGRKVEELLKNNIITPVIVICELAYKYKKLGIDFQKRLTFIKSRSQIYNFDEKLALSAATIKAEKLKTIKNFGVADAIILATAKHLKAKVVTGDKHFEGEDCIFI